MIAWRDMAVWYANNKAFELGTPLPNCITLEDLEEKEALHQSSRYAPITTDLEIPAFTSLDIKGLKNIGVSLKWIC